MHRAAWFSEYPVHAAYEIQVFKVFIRFCTLSTTVQGPSRFLSIVIHCTVFTYLKAYTLHRAWCTVCGVSYIWYDLSGASEYVKSIKTHNTKRYKKCIKVTAPLTVPTPSIR